MLAACAAGCDRGAAPGRSRRRRSAPGPSARSSTCSTAPSSSRSTHIEDGRVAERAEVVRLAAGGRVERRPVEHDERAAVWQRARFDNGPREPAEGSCRSNRDASSRCSGLRRVRGSHAGLRKPFARKHAAVAAAARTAIGRRIVAAVRQRVVEAELETALDDFAPWSSPSAAHECGSVRPRRRPSSPGWPSSRTPACIRAGSRDSPSSRARWRRCRCRRRRAPRPRRARATGTPCCGRARRSPGSELSIARSFGTAMSAGQRRPADAREIHRQLEMRARRQVPTPTRRAASSSRTCRCP